MDGTTKHVEMVALRLTISYSLIVSLNEYSLGEHEKKEHAIELWLSGQIKIFQNEEELANFNKKEVTKQKQTDVYVR